jgi:hypothetical protein
MTLLQKLGKTCKNKSERIKDAYYLGKELSERELETHFRARQLLPQESRELLYNLAAIQLHALNVRDNFDRVQRIAFRVGKLVPYFEKREN